MTDLKSLHEGRHTKLNLQDVKLRRTSPRSDRWQVRRSTQLIRLETQPISVEATVCCASLVAKLCATRMTETSLSRKVQSAPLTLSVADARKARQPPQW